MPTLDDKVIVLLLLCMELSNNVIILRTPGKGARKSIQGQ